MKRAAPALLLMSMLAALPAQSVEPVISASRARALFILHCAGCHQIDGSGQPHVGVPSMRGNLGHFAASPAGRAFMVQAPGARNASVSDAELAAMTNWQMQAFSKETLPPGFTRYTTEEVAQARRHPPLDVAAARAAILHDLQRQGKPAPPPVASSSNY